MISFKDLIFKLDSIVNPSPYFTPIECPNSTDLDSIKLRKPLDEINDSFSLLLGS